MDRIQKVLCFSAEKHNGQVDKAGNDYILHPVSIALQLQTESQKIVALLHDILEDTDTTEQELIDLGVTKKELYAIKLLTRDKSISYMDYIKKVKSCDLAKNVKIEDLKHNLLNRGEYKQNMESLKKRYKEALEYLLK